nr:uncharacterized protein LOC102128748 [Macaca fascicularis]
MHFFFSREPWSGQEPGFSPANCSQRLPSIPASPQEPFQLALGLWGPLHRGASWNSLPVSAGTLGWLLRLKLPSRGGVLPLPHRHPDIPPKLEETAPSDLETSDAGPETLRNFPHAGFLMRGWQEISCASHAPPSSRVSERITSIPPTSQDGCAHSFIHSAIFY